MSVGGPARTAAESCAGATARCHMSVSSKPRGTRPSIAPNFLSRHLLKQLDIMSVTIQMLQLITSIGIAVAVICYTTTMLLFREKVVYKGKVSTSLCNSVGSIANHSMSSPQRCYITGGSSGLGLALSEILVKRGAHVVIVARDKVKLDIAETSLMVRERCQTPA